MSQSPEATIVQSCQQTDERLRVARELSFDPRFNGLLDMLVRINAEQQRIAASLDKTGQQLDDIEAARRNDRAA